MIKIEFSPTTHGHFLEYVTNVYIMRTTAGSPDIFWANGYSHGGDSSYIVDRQISCRDIDLQQDGNPIIRIVVDTKPTTINSIVFFNRLIRKATPNNFPAEINNNKKKLRDIFYDRLVNNEFWIDDKYLNLDNNDSNIFLFPISSFYHWTDFCRQLNQLAGFLNQTFFPNSDLYNLWKKFIDINQGLQSYNKCQLILENSFSNVPQDIKCKAYEEAWINFNITKICNIHDGPLFDQKKYPSNTQEIYTIIQNHLSKLK